MGVKNVSKYKRPGGWRGSAAQIAMSTEAITRWNRHGRHLHPKCGARRKSDGQPCQNLAMENGRCRFHGGRVPKGDGKWHRPLWPKAAAPDASAKLRRKLRDLQRAADKRAKRLARMTPEQRAAYDAWRRDHQPTSKADRARKRALRRQNLEAKKSIERLAKESPKPKTDLELEIERLKAELELSKQLRSGVFA